MKFTKSETRITFDANEGNILDEAIGILSNIIDYMLDEKYLFIRDENYNYLSFTIEKAEQARLLLKLLVNYGEKGEIILSKVNNPLDKLNKIK